MGIQGLLPFVNKACRHCDIKEFRGQTIAVDAYCWLHKGAYGCALELARGQETDSYVQYCMKLIKLLLSHEIKVILVFDGARLPAKKKTNEARKQQRELAREKGHRSLAEGNNTEADGFFRRGMDITPEMVTNVIEACQALRRNDVNCIVAPYESDAQLAYLNNNGFADVVLSEDSDLILFGCKKIIFKSFKFNQSSGDLFESDKLLPTVFGNLEPKRDFTLFRRMCVLSGCDYADGLPGFGLAKAKKFFQKVSSSSSRDIRSCLKRIPIVMNMKDTRVTDEYIELFVAAENTFLHQLVYDPERHCLVPLNPYPEGVTAEIMPYAGKILDDKIATEIAKGNLCPHTHRQRGKKARAVNDNGLPKRRSPRKTPTKSPRKLAVPQPKTAFETGHVRSVALSKSAPKKVAADLYFEKSMTMSMYDTGPEQSLTRSRYFTSSSGSQESDVSSPSSTPSSRKRSLFDSLDNTDCGDEEESEESGFYDSNTPNSSSTPISNASKKPAWSKVYSFRSTSQDSNASGTSPLLSAVSGRFSQFQYIRGGASQGSG